MSVEKDIPVSEIATVGTDVTVYRRTPNRRFVLREVTVGNRGGAAGTVRFFDGPSADGRQKLAVVVGAGSTESLGNLMREFKYGDVVVQTDATPVVVSGSGEEE